MEKKSQLLEEKIVAQKKEFFKLNLLDGLYNLSCGLGPLALAVEKFTAGEELSDFFKIVLLVGTNYLNNPYSHFFTDDEKYHYKDIGPHKVSPYAEKYLSLLMKLIKQKNTELYRSEIRFVLGGEEFLLAKSPSELITEEELKQLLTKAKEKGLINFDQLVLKNQFSYYDQQSFVAFFRFLTHENLTLTDQFFNLVDEKKTDIFTNKFRPEVLELVIYKLATMLLLTEQVAFDAQTLGIPISRNYKPNESPNWEKNWQETLNQPMPVIEDLYKQAYAVFTKVASKDDNNLAFLFDEHFETLPYLV